MKVAYLMGSLNLGGSETLILDICRNAKAQNFDLLLVHRKNGRLKDEFLKSGVKLRQIFSKNILDFTYFFKLRKIVLDNKIQVLHAHQVIDALYAYIATLFLPVKLVISFHGHGLNDNWISRILRQHILVKTDVNIYVSTAQKRFYENKYKNTGKSLVVPNGIDFSKFEISNPKSIREELGLGNTDFLIGKVGNFTSGRDHFTLCKFIQLLKKENVVFKFVFIGGASSSEPLIYKKCLEFCQEHGLCDNVYFLGSRTDVPVILSQLNAFIYSTEHDTFGIAAVEAMATGVPVFVNDWEVMQEISDSGQLATLYKSKDEKDLLNKFVHFLNNSDSYKKKAHETAIIVRDKYSIERHILTLKNIYSSLVLT